tara:strand:- start:50 stop:373 length:324 start_codon:yes stop_codon:yes gene_type:complete
LFTGASEDVLFNLAIFLLYVSHGSLLRDVSLCFFLLFLCSFCVLFVLGEYTGKNWVEHVAKYRHKMNGRKIMYGNSFFNVARCDGKRILKQIELLQKRKTSNGVLID